MNSGETAAADILMALYRGKKERNAAYSTHAFARDLGVSQTLISLLLNGKRRLPLKRALQFCARLGLSQDEIRKLLEASALSYGETPGARAVLSLVVGGGRGTSAEAGDSSDTLQLEMDRFQVIREWHHVAILDLTTLEGFVPEARWISSRLGVPVMEVRSAVRRLERLGLLEIEGSAWKKTSVKVAVPTQRSENAVRDFHRQMIGKAVEQLELTAQKDFERRSIVGSTIATNPAQLAEARALIERFRKKLAKVLTTGAPTELYQLNVQLFPLTKSDSKEEKGETP